MTSEAVVAEIGSGLTAACEVQHRFMHHGSRVIDAAACSGRCRQLYELGGDCYDFLPLPGNRMALAVGDASGKGLAAALMISNVQSSLRTAALFAGDDPVAMLRAVNSQVHAASLAGRYATLFYGVFDRGTRTLSYVNAGHNPPMVIRGDGSITWLETGGAPVGIFPDWIYEQGKIELDPGDVVVIYSDGVIEAQNTAGEEWQMEGLRTAAAASEAQTADDLVDAIFMSMDEYSHGNQTDDATVAVLRVD